MRAVEWYSESEDARAAAWFAAPRVVIVGAAPWGPYSSEGDAISNSYDLIGEVYPDWSEGQKQIALAIGWAESRFGVTPDFQMPDGSPSWNWGAVVATGTAGTIPHADHSADGKPVTWNFAAFHNASEGLEFWGDRWPGLTAARTGNARGAAEAMYQKCWFSGTCPPSCTDGQRIEAYAQVIVGAAAHVTKSLGIASQVQLGSILGLPMGGCSFHDKPSTGGGGKPPNSTPGTTDSGSGGLLIVGGLLLGGALLVMR